MPRRATPRKVVKPPGFRGYKPYGAETDSRNPVELMYEEYEAVKLADYDLMNHQEACRLMGISRPTFARIYESARRKIALAMVETREIKTVFGNAMLDKSWVLCLSCNARFTVPEGFSQNQCPVCGNTSIEPINQDDK